VSAGSAWSHPWAWWCLRRCSAGGSWCPTRAAANCQRGIGTCSCRPCRRSSGACTRRAYTNERIEIPLAWISCVSRDSLGMSAIRSSASGHVLGQASCCRISLGVGAVLRVLLELEDQAWGFLSLPREAAKSPWAELPPGDGCHQGGCRPTWPQHGIKD
jgi:hypothetical protein